MTEWKETELGEVADVQTGPFGSQLKNEQYTTGSKPAVTVDHNKILGFLTLTFQVLPMLA